MVNLFLTIIRALFALIDTIVVWAIKNLYVLLIQIANTNVFGEFIYQILGRIYVFLGLFMVFKLSMSMITYIINPDAMTDKGKGFSKLITNVVISLILVVTVPTIFKEAFRLQYMILDSNAIYQIVTGRAISDPSASADDKRGTLEENASYLADQIARGVFQSFIYKDTGDIGADSEVDVDSIAPLDEGDKPCTTAECYVAVSTVTKSGSGTNGFANEYKFLLSTICGAVVAYFFLVFCLDAATRAIKLGMLQIIAPIPILSMMDPKTGNEKLKKWASNCGKEFAGLFIRLAGVFFATEVIRQIMSGENKMLHYYAANGGISDVKAGFFVQLFIILGCLMFAKQLPQFIENVLGVKLSGGDGFNLKKRLAGAVGVGAVAGAAGLGAKKLVAGIDSARHGKGFWNGTKNVQGNGFISKMQKGWRDMNPNATEFHQNRKKAQESMSQRERALNRGKSLFEQHGGSEESLLKGFNQDYVDSYNRAEDLKKEMFAAESELDAARQTGDATKIAAASAVYGAAKKKYDMANANYEDMKVIHSKDAEAHDAFNMYKKMNGGSSGGSSTTTSSNAGNATQTAQPTSKPASDSRAAAYQQTHSSDTSTWE